MYGMRERCIRDMIFILDVDPFVLLIPNLSISEMTKRKARRENERALLRTGEGANRVWESDLVSGVS